ncbi:MAG: DUF268 domain-containing protein [Planctomycetota bacterium]|jgi:SAM-dependent methyltransferase
MNQAKEHPMGLGKHFRRWRRRKRKEAGFKREFLEFKRLSDEVDRDLSVSWSDKYPCLDDKTPSTGFDRHYVYHTAWATRILARTKPENHVDISSSVYFCALASAIVPIKHYDFRPPDLVVDGLSTHQGSLLNLPFDDASVGSLSCMHVLEHIGLARYGDDMDPLGDQKAAAELSRVLATDGRLLVAVPVGRPRVQFNAHRIYSYEQVSEFFNDLELEEFTLIPDKARDGHLITGASAEQCNSQKYACGCFVFRKQKSTQ